MSITLSSECCVSLSLSKASNLTRSLVTAGLLAMMLVSLRAREYNKLLSLLDFLSTTISMPTLWYCHLPHCARPSQPKLNCRISFRLSTQTREKSCTSVCSSFPSPFLSPMIIRFPSGVWANGLRQNQTHSIYYRTSKSWRFAVFWKEAYRTSRTSLRLSSWSDGANGVRISTSWRHQAIAYHSARWRQLQDGRQCPGMAELEDAYRYKLAVVSWFLC